MINKRSIGSRITDVCLVVLLSLSAFATLYPFIYVFSMSLSEPMHVLKHDVYFWPKGFSLSSYVILLRGKEIWQYYYNTIWYTVVGTAINVIMTVIIAYPLSKKEFFIRNLLITMIAITMFFGGGMIPKFILINNIGLYNTRWALVIPSAVSAWYIFIARTYFNSIPDSIEESAKIDGANEIKILFKLIIPLSMPIISVLLLFYAVGHWNSFFNAILYLPDAKLHPLQIFLRKILIELSQDAAGDTALGIERASQVEQIKYSSIMATVLPILCVYPFLQKYFVKGIMIGSIKG